MSETQLLRVAQSKALRANAQLFRKKFLQSFDWDNSRLSLRKWVSDKMQIPFEICFVSRFTIEQCERFLLFCEPYIEKDETNI